MPCRSVGLSVRPSVRHIFEFRAVFALLLLPNRPRLDCRVSGLVLKKLGREPVREPLTIEINLSIIICVSTRKCRVLFPWAICGCTSRLIFTLVFFLLPGIMCAIISLSDILLLHWSVHLCTWSIWPFFSLSRVSLFALMLCRLSCLSVCLNYYISVY